MQHISIRKFSRWLRIDQFFLSTLLFKIYLVILSGAYLLLSGAADCQNHWKTAERGQSYTKERGANLVVSFIFIAISFFEILYYGTERGVAIGMGSRIQRAPDTYNPLWKATELKMQFAPQVQLAWVEVVNPLMVTALKAASSRRHLHWRKHGWTEVLPLPLPKNSAFCVT